MKIAILIHGQPRFTDYIFDFIENKLDNINLFDWYFYLWDQTPQDDNRIPSWWTTDIKDNKLFNFISLQPNQTVKQVEFSQMNDYNFDFSRFPNTIQETVPVNVWFMHKSLFNTFQMIKNIDEYDLVIKIRGDCTVNEPLPLDASLNFIQENPQCLITSHYHTYGYNNRQINDWFAVGNPYSMKIYCSLFPNLMKYCSAGLLLHPESLLVSHLILNEIDWVYSNILIRCTGKN